MQAKSLFIGTTALLTLSGLALPLAVGAAEVRQSGITCVDAHSPFQDGSRSTSDPVTHGRGYRGMTGVYNPSWSLLVTVACPIPDSSYLYPEYMRTIRLTGFDGSPSSAVSAFLYVAYSGGQGGKSLKKLYSGGTQVVGTEAYALDVAFTGKFDLNFVTFGQPLSERLTSANRYDTKVIMVDIPAAGGLAESKVSELYFKN